MRLRIFLSASIFLLVLLLTSSQLTKAQLADEPITGPVTGPITSPITETPTATPTETPTTTVTPTETPTPTPITNPIPNGKSLIRGRVIYAIFRFFPGLLRVPANSVKVEAVNVRTHERYLDRTDSSGNYEMIVTPGVYSIHPKSPRVFFFIPWVKAVQVSADETKDRVNFTGYVFLFP